MIIGVENNLSDLRRFLADFCLGRAAWPASQPGRPQNLKESLRVLDISSGFLEKLGLAGRWPEIIKYHRNRRGHIFQTGLKRTPTGLKRTFRLQNAESDISEN